MRYADSDQLATAVKGAVAASSLASKIAGVDVEIGDFNDEGEFIRVLIHIKNLVDISDEDVDRITSSIEGAVSKYDDRFPSVRFSEP
jgi:hypothetical protein